MSKFRVVAFLSTMILLWAASAWAAGQTAIQPGSYLTDGGWGELTIKRGKGGKTFFRIFAMGGNAHMCELEGEIKGGKAVLAEAVEDRGEPCVVLFTPKGENIEVIPQTPESCRYFCGMRASFEGTYQRPAPGCLPRVMSRTRAEFKRMYDKKQYAEALASLEPLLKNCEKTITWLDKGRIQNDLAVTLHKLGRYDDCIRILEPLAEDAAKTDEQIKSDYPPSDAESYLPIVKSTRTNLKLCRTGKTKP